MGICKRSQIQSPAMAIKLAALIGYAIRVAGKSGADAEARAKLHEALFCLTPSACQAKQKPVFADRKVISLYDSLFAEESFCHAMTQTDEDAERHTSTSTHSNVVLPEADPSFKNTLNNLVERVKEDVRVLSDKLDLLERKDAMSLRLNHLESQVRMLSDSLQTNREPEEPILQHHRDTKNDARNVQQQQDELDVALCSSTQGKPMSIDKLLEQHNAERAAVKQCRREERAQRIASKTTSPDGA